MTKFWRQLTPDKKVTFILGSIMYLLMGVWLTAKMSAGFDMLEKQLNRVEMRLDSHIDSHVKNLR